MSTLLRIAWTGAKGAAKYVNALRTGDIAPTAAAEARVRSACAVCPAVTIERGRRSGVVLAFCGPALVERLGEDVPVGARTCGCLVGHVERDDRRAVAEAPAGTARQVALSVLKPAGKPAVASEACPRGRFAAVAPVGCCGGACGCQAGGKEGAG